MAEDDLSEREIRRMAGEIGLTRLTDAHLQSLLRATSSARARRDKLRIEQLSYADEPAHVFSLAGGSAP